MQLMSDELRRVIESRLKLGQLAKPVCRVEVDRMVFIPGRTEEIQYKVPAILEELDDTYITDDANAKTVTSPQSIMFPAKGYDLSCKSSPFGMRWGKPHQGVDLAVPTGTEIVAAWAGKVTQVNMKSAKKGYGYYVDVEHSNGYVTRYAHLSKPLVKTKQQVTQGQVIALSGSTGNSTGPHLHFEVHKNGKKVDPAPYLKGQFQMSNPSTNAGTGVTKTGTISGHLGEKLFEETFSGFDWFKDSKYSSVDPLLQTSSMVIWKGLNWNTSFNQITFRDNQPATMGFNFKVKSTQPGVVSLNFASDMQGVGDIRIYVDQQLKVKFQDFRGLDNIETIHNVAFQAGGNGEREIRIEVRYAGYSDTGKTYTMLFEHLSVRKFEGTPEMGTLQFIDPTDDTTSAAELSLADAIMGNESTNRVSLQVGQFSYMDTLVLDSVSSVELDDQFEMDSREARVTISNPKGYYSPDYNPFYFPEVYQQTPWSYFINGYHYGVLSDNAPIRIFLGYGNNLMRVFTGLIDKVDMEAETPQITISCRDMYKKILNKVLDEDKEYPEDVGHATYNSSAYGNNPSMSRKEEIIAKAKYYTKQTNNSMDYKFILAIAHHETQYGTTGAGRDESGSYILGYGVYGDNDKDSRFAGIDKQLVMGAKRYVEAMKSRGWQINSLADVEYFWRGGDKGAYQWAKDTNWPNAVWTIYSGYKQSPPAEFANTPEWSGSANSVETATATPPANDTPQNWVKSAILMDLIDHAGMTGWRAALNDVAYPDYIIEETYLIELNQRTGKAVMAVPGEEGVFEEREIETVLTPQGWKNPFVDEARNWPAYTAKVSDCINEVIKDTNYRVHCDRYGTFRGEQIDLKKPVVSHFTDQDHLVSLNKTIDYSNARSHVVIVDKTGKFDHFKDTELLMDLKGELRTTLLEVPYASTYESKKNIADRFFWDVKRLSRTLQISIPGNPALDVLDRVYISDKSTTTRNTYTIKGIRSSFTVDGGYLQVLDLMWSGEGKVI